MAHLLGTRIDKTADAMAESGVTAVEAGFPLDPAMGGTMKETAVTADRAFRNAGIEVRVVHPALGLERDLSSADDALRACYDSGHANITDHPAHAIGVMAPVLGHLHLHDNDGTADQHRMPGEGSIDWGAVGDALRTACYGGPALLELALADGHTAASMRSRTLELMGYAAE